MESILETYPDAVPKSLTVGDDNYIHFVDGFGESWCATGFTTYYLDDLGENLELHETVDDGPLTSFCPGCKEGADDEKQETAAEL